MYNVLSKNNNLFVQDLEMCRKASPKELLNPTEKSRNDIYIIVKFKITFLACKKLCEKEKSIELLIIKIYLQIQLIIWKYYL